MEKKNTGGCPGNIRGNVVPGRRRLLQAAWVTPVVSSVCLPAHAATSSPRPPVRIPPVPPDPSVVVTGDPLTPSTFPNDPVLFTVTNTGNVPVTTGVVSVDVPVTFINLVFPSTIPSLPPGESVVVSITFESTEPCPSYPGTFTVSADFAEASGEVEVIVVCTV